MSSTVTVYIPTEDTAPYTILMTHHVEEQFDDMLNETNEPIKIMGMDYDVARTFKEVDPVAYRETLLNYLDGSYTELEMPWDLYWSEDQDAKDAWVAHELGEDDDED